MEIKKQIIKHAEKKRQKELALESLREKRKSLEEEKKYREEMMTEKKKIKELGGESTFKKVGGGVLVEIKKGAKALGKSTSTFARRSKGVSEELFGRTGKKGKIPSLFGDEGFKFGEPKNYFSETPSYFGVEKPKVVRKVKRRKKKRK